MTNGWVKGCTCGHPVHGSQNKCSACSCTETTLLLDIPADDSNTGVTRLQRQLQTNPRDQICVSIMAAQGHLLNIQDGTVKPENIDDRLEQVLKFLEEAQAMLRQMPEGTWDE